MSRKTATRAGKNVNLGLAAKTDFITRTVLEDVLDRKFVSFKQDLATKDDKDDLKSIIKDLKSIIKEQKSKINVLESKVVL